MDYKVKARWAKQTKRFHRYEIEGTGTGTIYIPLEELPSALSADFPKILDVSIKEEEK